MDISSKVKAATNLIKDTSNCSSDYQTEDHWIFFYFICNPFKNINNFGIGQFEG